MKTQIGCQWDAKVCLDVSTEVEVEDHLWQPRRRQKMASKLRTHKVYIDVSTKVVDQLRQTRLSHTEHMTAKMTTHRVCLCHKDLEDHYWQHRRGLKVASQTWAET